MPARRTPGKPPAPQLRTIPGGDRQRQHPVGHRQAPRARRGQDLRAAPAATARRARQGPAAQFAGRASRSRSPTTPPSPSTASRSTAAAIARPARDPVVYVEDSTAPHTRITIGPGVQDPQAHGRSSASPTPPATRPAPPSSAGSTAGKWKPCSSPLQLQHLGHARHMLRVKAIDAAGNAEAQPAQAQLQGRSASRQSAPPARVELRADGRRRALRLLRSAWSPAASRPRSPTGCRAGCSIVVRALGVPRLRRPDRRLRQRPGLLLAAAAGPGALLRRADLAALPADRAGRRAALRRDRRSSTATTRAEVAIGLVFVTMLAAITLTDLERRIIPNKILLAGVDPLPRDRRSRPIPAACPSGRSPPRRPAA